MQLRRRADLRGFDPHQAVFAGRFRGPISSGCPDGTGVDFSGADFAVPLLRGVIELGSNFSEARIRERGRQRMPCSIRADQRKLCLRAPWHPSGSRVSNPTSLECR